MWTGRLKTTAEDGERGAEEQWRAMEDSFHGRAAATENALSPTVDRRVRRTSRDVDEAERTKKSYFICSILQKCIPLIFRKYDRYRG